MDLIEKRRLDNIRKGDLVSLVVKLHGSVVPVGLNKPLYRAKSAPRKRFGKHEDPLVSLALDQEHHGIVVDKYKRSESWGSGKTQRYHLVTCFHVLFGEQLVFFTTEQLLEQWSSFLFEFGVLNHDDDD